jgi:hypothetical protein
VRPSAELPALLLFVVGVSVSVSVGVVVVHIGMRHSKFIIVLKKREKTVERDKGEKVDRNCIGIQHFSVVS